MQVKLKIKKLMNGGCVWYSVFFIGHFKSHKIFTNAMIYFIEMKHILQIPTAPNKAWIVKT